MKVAIIGSRKILDYEVVKKFILNNISLDTIELIISGGASGVDCLAEKFASEFNIKTQIFLADWKKFKKSAGIIRNKDIISNADIIFAIWDGSSRGTKNSIDLAKKLNKKLFIQIYNEQNNLEIFY